MKIEFKLQVSKEEMEILQGKFIDEAKEQGYQEAKKRFNQKLKIMSEVVKAVAEAASISEKPSEAENQQEMEDTHEHHNLSTPIEEHHIEAAANAFGVSKSRVRELLNHYGVTTFEEFLNHPEIPADYKNYVNEYL